jgi:hypothetical protein
MDIRKFSITNNKRRVFSKNIKKCFLAKASEIGNKITLPIVLSLNKTVYVQLKDSPYDCIFLCMNKLIDLIMNDIQLQDISSVMNCLQLFLISVTNKICRSWTSSAENESSKASWLE